MQKHAHDTTVTCPVCGVSNVRIWVDPGQKQTYDTPPIQPGVDDFEADCECADSRLVDDSEYMEELEDIVFDR